MPRVSGPGRASVTSRALSVLGTFDAAHTRRTLTEIAAAADLPLSTTHRLVAELVAWEGLTRGVDGSYEIGRRIWDLGALAAVSRELRATALPFMQDLCATTGENVHIAVLEGTKAFIRRPDIRKEGGPDRQPAGRTVAAAHHRRRKGAPRPCESGCSTAVSGKSPTGHPAHRHRAPTTRSTARAGPRTRLRHHFRRNDDRGQFDRRSGHGRGRQGGRRVGPGHPQPLSGAEPVGARCATRRARCQSEPAPRPLTESPQRRALHSAEKARGNSPGPSLVDSYRLASIRIPAKKSDSAWCPCSGSTWATCWSGRTTTMQPVSRLIPRRSKMSSAAGSGQNTFS